MTDELIQQNCVENLMEPGAMTDGLIRQNYSEDVIEPVVIMSAPLRHLPQYNTPEHAEELKHLLEQWGMSSCFDFFIRTFTILYIEFHHLLGF